MPPPHTPYTNVSPHHEPPHRYTARWAQTAIRLPTPRREVGSVFRNFSPLCTSDLLDSRAWLGAWLDACRSTLAPAHNISSHLYAVAAACYKVWTTSSLTSNAPRLYYLPWNKRPSHPHGGRAIVTKVACLMRGES